MAEGDAQRLHQILIGYLLARSAATTLGVVLCAVGSTYELSETVRIAGWPFPFAIFIHGERGWIDYIAGPSSLLGNILTRLALVNGGYAVVLFGKSRRALVHPR